MIWGCLCYLLVRTSNIDHKKNSKVYHVIFQNNIKVAIHQLLNNLTVTEVIQRVWRKTCTGLGDWLYKHDSQDSTFFSFFACVCSSLTQKWKKVFEMFSNYYHTGNSSSVDLKNSPYGYFPKRDCSSGERCVLSLELMDFFFFSFGNWWDTTQANLTEILWRPEMPWYKVSPWNTLGWFSVDLSL